MNEFSLLKVEYACVGKGLMRNLHIILSGILMVQGQFYTSKELSRCHIQIQSVPHQIRSFIALNRDLKDYAEKERYQPFKTCKRLLLKFLQKVPDF